MYFTAFKRFFGDGYVRRRKSICKQRGWSQSTLAKKVDTSGAIIGRYECGEITPSIGDARKLAEVLEVTLDIK